MKKWNASAYFNRNDFIRDSNGYFCRGCKKRVYKHKWEKTSLEDALRSHYSTCAMRFISTVTDGVITI